MSPCAKYFQAGELDRMPGITNTVKQYARIIERLATRGAHYATSIRSLATERACRAAVHWMERVEQGHEATLFPALREKLLAISRDVGGAASLRELLSIPRAHQLAVVRHRVEDLRAFPVNWAEATAAALEKVPNRLDRAALSVLFLTGCRPSEIKYACVRCEATIVIITLLGAKFRPGDLVGQAARDLAFEPQGLAMNIPRLLGIGDIELDEDFYSHVQPFARFKDKHVAKLVAKLGKDALGSDVELLPSHFRQLLASRLKAENRSQQEIACILGHISTRSQKFYGRAKLGRGRVGVLPLPQLAGATSLPREKSTLDAMKSKAYAELEAKWGPEALP